MGESAGVVGLVEVIADSSLRAGDGNAEAFVEAISTTHELNASLVS